MNKTDFQEEFLRRLNNKHSSKNVILPELIKIIQNSNDDIVELGLGDIGKKIKEFLNLVDLDHPDLCNVFNGILNDPEFSKICLELLCLAKYVKKEELNYLSPIISNILVKEFDYKNIKVDLPVFNRMNVRFLKDKNIREEVRALKKMQVIDLDGLYKKGEEVWKAQKSNFDLFLRYDISYLEDIKKAEKKIKRFEELGCASLAEDIRRSITDFPENIDKNYYGFNRITILNAAVILAKSLDFNYEISKSSDGLFEKSKISISKKFFFDYNFDPISTFSIFEGAIFNEKTEVFYDYEPRIYPLHEFLDLASEKTVEIINTLDNFPECNNKPIFDHFGIIIPGVNFPLTDKNNQFYTFLDKSGLLRSYSSREEAIKEFDRILVRDKHISPIILGEYEGKAYFICYFD